jgi:hypothetical protein
MSVTIILQAPNTATITHTGAVSATITQSGAVSATIQQVVGQGVSVQNIVPNSVTINTGGASGGGTLDSVTSAGNTTANSIEVGSVIANGNFLITGLDSLVELRGTSVDFNIQTADAENIARIATTTGGSSRFQLYNHTEGFEGAEEFKATTWEDDALVISGGIPTTTKLLVSRNPNEATLQVTGDASISGDIILTSPNDTAYRIVVGNDGTLAAIPPTSTAPSITTLPTISGTLEVGETLTATAGNVSGDPTPTRVLQWQRSDNGTTGWADISGATGTTYLLGSLDEDKYIRVAQTEENILGTATANSASTAQIQPAAVLLLDGYPNAAAAYSLRKLRNLYTGDAIIVRRASDNATQSIGFIGNQLDTASLESFCAGTDGFVTTWFDQSGNGNDAAQTFGANQPQIVASGSTMTEGTKPVLSFNGTSNRLVAPDSDTLSFTDGAGNDTPLNVFMAYHNNATSNSVILGKDDGTPNREYALGYFDADLRFFVKENGGNTQISKDNKDSGQLDYLLMSAFYDGSENVNGFTMFKNGVASTLGDIIGSTISGMANTSANLYIGTYINSGSFCFDGTMQEIVMYGSNQSSNRAGIETNINAFYNIY